HVSILDADALAPGGCQGVAAVEPRRRLEPLEDLAGLRQQRRRLLLPTAGGEPLTVFELSQGEVEGQTVFAEDDRSGLEPLLDAVLLPPCGEDGPETRGLGDQERWAFPWRDRVDSFQQLLQLVEPTQGDGCFEGFAERDLHVDRDTGRKLRE